MPKKYEYKNMTIKQVAQGNYEHFCSLTMKGGMTILWDDLPGYIRDAWIAVTHNCCNEIRKEINGRRPRTK